jgi:hypothetical protein
MKKTWEDKMAELIDKELDECADRHDTQCYANDIIALARKEIEKARKDERKRIKKMVETIDDTGGGSGRRIKIQLLGWLKEK